ncbi:collagen-like protein [Bacillus spizizenii]|uniref:collagen-like protein n=1 Tax=Bacillus inaquosorum TaxID=483913 RepID=UPI00227E119E|nr:collagen-like protein [Bacillus inaquosorum]MCY8324258.1 collagen-like protein [Bacillus spizizenii]MCY9071903.1 collagen-like protein [Bacillus inaquosorum]MEC0661407.1 collagen-like protein [Bacillus spizizenii]MEC0703057.1 collagen-like protein [Bacillus spizizenii]
MAEDYLYESGGVKTSSEKGADGKAITPVYLKENSEENPVYVKGLQGEPGPPGPKGDPAVIEKGSITHEMLGDKSVRSNNIGSGSIMMDNLNPDVKTVFDQLQKQIDELKNEVQTLKGTDEAPQE